VRRHPHFIIPQARLKARARLLADYFKDIRVYRLTAASQRPCIALLRRLSMDTPSDVTARFLSIVIAARNFWRAAERSTSSHSTCRVTPSVGSRVTARRMQFV
jgi:hypothetical protein